VKKGAGGGKVDPPENWERKSAEKRKHSGNFAEHGSEPKSRRKGGHI